MKPYYLRVLIALDQFFATLLLPENSEDCTISDWAWRNQCKPMIKFIDFLFYDGHCKDSFERDE